MVAIGWFLGGIAGGVTGIGGAMIAIPIMMISLSTENSILISCLICIFASTQLALNYRHACRWSDIKYLILGAAPGCFLGVLLLRSASMAVLQLVLCIVLFAFVSMQSCRTICRYRLPDSVFTGIATGVICGAVNASVAMVGAPLGIYALLKHWSPDRSRGNINVFLMFPNYGSVFFQALSGFYTVPILKLAAAGVISCYVGTKIGVYLGHKIDQEMFRKLILLILILIAVILLIRACRSF